MASKNDNNNKPRVPPPAASSSRKRSADALQELPIIHRLRLEAIFHPKFDNEKVEQKAIRQRMLTKPGYLEVSLKHSGSLVLWSGQSNVYSKNGIQNVYSAAAEVLLHQLLPKEQFEECSTGCFAAALRTLQSHHHRRTSLGNNIVRQLCEGPYEVRVLLRESSNRQTLADLPVEMECGALDDDAAIHRAMESVDARSSFSIDIVRSC